jgi:hypothetical protein
MAQNRKKHANSLPVASLAKWIIAAFFLGVIGLSYVYLKNQHLTTGDEIKRLEREFDSLNTQNDLMRGRIAALSSRSVLQRRLNEGFIKMIPVTDDRIVRINTAPSRNAQGEIRPVSNEVAAK